MIIDLLTRRSRRDMLKGAVVTVVSSTALLALPGIVRADARPVQKLDLRQRHLGSAPTTTAGSVAVADRSPRFQAVARVLEAAMAEQHLPGVALGILADGIEEHAVFGVESIGTGAPVTNDTRFQIGSVTKTFTGTAIMRLVGESRIDLDATVRTYLPSLRLADPDVAARVTVRHLLTHTAGWFGDAVLDFGSDDDALARYIDEALPTFPQLFPLGAFFSYSNSGFMTLGRLIEVITGRPYRLAMRELLFEPLGLGQTTLDHPLALAGAHAEGHWYGAQGLEIQTPLLIPKVSDPAGGVWSTTRDMLRFARFHQGDGSLEGRPVMPRSTLHLMQQPWVAAPGLPGLSIGMPWMVQQIDGQRMVSHSGDTAGQHADFVMVPDRSFAITMLANAEPGGWQAFQSVAAEAFAQYLGSSAGAAAGAIGALIVAPGTPEISLPADRLAEYVGRYRQPGLNMDVRSDGDRLLLSVELIEIPNEVRRGSEPPPPAVDLPLSFVGEDAALLGPMRLPFVRRSNGTVGWVANNLRLIPQQA